ASHRLRLWCKDKKCGTGLGGATVERLTPDQKAAC
ncbi:hypothetical protein AVEN_134483-1, partial [Araneus ventricosus]